MADDELEKRDKKVFKCANCDNIISKGVKRCQCGYNFYCPLCYTVLGRKDAHNCQACGYKIKWFSCRGCGSDVVRGIEKCSNCGIILDWGEESERLDIERKVLKYEKDIKKLEKKVDDETKIDSAKKRLEKLMKRKKELGEVIRGKKGLAVSEDIEEKLYKITLELEEEKRIRKTINTELDELKKQLARTNKWLSRGVVGVVIIMLITAILVGLVILGI